MVVSTESAPGPVLIRSRSFTVFNALLIRATSHTVQMLGWDWKGLTAPLNTSEQAKKVSSTTQKTKKISAYSNPVLKVLSFLSHFDLEFLFCLLMLCFNFEFHYIKYSFL